MNTCVFCEQTGKSVEHFTLAGRGYRACHSCFDLFHVKLIAFAKKELQAASAKPTAKTTPPPEKAG